MQPNIATVASRRAQWGLPEEREAMEPNIAPHCTGHPFFPTSGSVLFAIKNFSWYVVASYLHFAIYFRISQKVRKTYFIVFMMCDPAC